PPPATSPLSLHDALPICGRGGAVTGHVVGLGRHLAQQLRTGVLPGVLELNLADDGDAVVGDGRRTELLLEHHVAALGAEGDANGDRKSTRLNSSHVAISY